MDRWEKRVFLSCSLVLHISVLAFAFVVKPSPSWRAALVFGGLFLSVLSCLMQVSRFDRPLGGGLMPILGQVLGLTIVVTGEPRLLSGAAACAVWLGPQCVCGWPGRKGLSLAVLWGVCAGGALIPLALRYVPLALFVFTPFYPSGLILSSLLVRHWRLRAEDVSLLDNAREASALLAKANLSLQEYMVKERQLTVARERSRLAREINDKLGHTLTAILVQLGAVAEMIQGRSGSIPQRVEGIRRAVRQGMLEVRAAVEALRTTGEERPRGEKLWKLAANTFAEAAMIEVVTRIGDDFSGLSEEADEVIYRAIQEGLTNAVRHGHATRVEISIRLEKSYLLVRVSDNGRGAAQVIQGQGLRTMRERVASLGGAIEYRSFPGYGFDLGIDIPSSRAF